MTEPPETSASQREYSAGHGLRTISADRLASLSDTMFGVAMTLLATTLVPEAEQLTGSALGMLHTMAEPLGAVALSFAVAAIYWLSQQRRLSMMDELVPRQTALHLGFLFLIMMLPISTGIFARRDTTAAPVAIYGAHITLLALANLALWVDVHRRISVWRAIVPSTAAVIVLGSGFVIGLFRPWAAQYIWYGALALPVLTGPSHQALLRLRRRSPQD